MRTPVGRYVEAANGGDARLGAVVGYGSDIGMDDHPLGPSFEESVTVSGEEFSVLAPAGLRDGGDALATRYAPTFAAGEALAMREDVPETLTVATGEKFYRKLWVISGREFYPGSQWVPSTQWHLGEAWYPGSQWTTDEPANMTVVAQVPAEAGFEELFGTDPGEVGARRAEPGEEFDTATTMLVSNAPEDSLFPGEAALPERPALPDETFLGGHPAPLGGVTAGVFVFSTPDPSLAGQSANPLVGESTLDLLQRPEARDLLSQTAVPDAENVEYREVPTPVDAAGLGPETATLLDDEVEIESFAAALSGDSHPVAVGVHIARTTGEEHVVAGAVQRAPLGLGETAVSGFKRVDAPPETGVNYEVGQARTLLAEACGMTRRYPEGKTGR
jgi:hypothetical protein